MLVRHLTVRRLLTELGHRGNRTRLFVKQPTARPPIPLRVFPVLRVPVRRLQGLPIVQLDRRWLDADELRPLHFLVTRPAATHRRLAASQLPRLATRRL